MLFDVLLDALLDTVRLLPFLFLTYLLMEYLEHKTGQKSARMMGRAGKLGPLLGAAAGAVPQCGFSAAAARLSTRLELTGNSLSSLRSHPPLSFFTKSTARVSVS